MSIKEIDRLSTSVSLDAPSFTDEDIALIYEGPLETRPWKGYLDFLRTKWNADCAAMTLIDPHRDMPTLFLSEGRERSPTQRESLVAAHRRLAHLDPLGNALLSRGGILTLSEVASHDDLAGDAFYSEVLEPGGLTHQIGMLLREPSGARANIGLMSGPEKPDFGPAERAYFAAARPHLERALALFSRMQRSEQNKSLFDEILGKLNIAVFLMDGAERAIDLNAAAVALCDSGEVALNRGRLVMPGDRDTRRLNEALHEAEIRLRGHSTERHAAIFRTEHGHRPLDVLVRTVEGTRSRGTAATIAVCISSGGGEFAPSQQFVAELLRLTPIEARLTLLLVEGLTLREAADRIGVKENTVRSYSKQIFDKTGVHRQAELVRLILKSVVLIA